MMIRKERLTRAYIRLRGLTYIHACRSYVHTPRELDRHVSHKSLIASHSTRARWPIRPILGFWGAKFPKMGDYLLGTPMNHRANFDAACFILGGEILNRTNAHKITNKQ